MFKKVCEQRTWFAFVYSSPKVHCPITVACLKHGIVRRSMHKDNKRKWKPTRDIGVPLAPYLLQSYLRPTTNALSRLLHKQAINPLLHAQLYTLLHNALLFINKTFQGPGWRHFAKIPLLKIDRYLHFFKVKLRYWLAGYVLHSNVDFWIWNGRILLHNVFFVYQQNNSRSWPVTISNLVWIFRAPSKGAPMHLNKIDFIQ